MSTVLESSMDKSICKNCTYMIERLIIPLDEELYEIDRDELGIDAEETVTLTQHICAVLETDLEDHIVLQCNKFSSEMCKSLFLNK